MTKGRERNEKHLEKKKEKEKKKENQGKTDVVYGYCR